MLYQLSYDPLCVPPTYRIRSGAGCAPVRNRHAVRLLKANEVRVYVVPGASSNRKCPSGPWERQFGVKPAEDHQAVRRIRTPVLPGTLSCSVCETRMPGRLRV
ncbi:hypothetical protein GCM10020256_30530 [Streptomyces thermocoprophilus]